MPSPSMAEKTATKSARKARRETPGVGGCIPKDARASQKGLRAAARFIPAFRPLWGGDDQ